MIFTEKNQHGSHFSSDEQGHIDSRVGLLVVVAVCRSIVAFSTTFRCRKEGIRYRILGNSAHLHFGSIGHQGYGNHLGRYVWEI